MINVIVEVAKYVSIVMMIIYTYSAIVASIAKNKKRRGRLLIGMDCCTYIIHFAGYLVLFVANSFDVKYIMMYAAQFIIMLLAEILYNSFYKKKSGVVAANMRLFIILGYIMIMRIDSELGVKQMLFVSFMLILMLLIPYLIKKFKLWEKYKYVYIIVGIALLLATLVFGKELYGAKNWIIIAGFSIQPSEFCKILFVFGISAFLYKARTRIDLVKITLIAVVFPALLILEKDLGTAAVLYLTYVVLLYASCANYNMYRRVKVIGDDGPEVKLEKTGTMHGGRYAIMLCVCGVIGAVAAYFIFSHVRVRVAAFLNPVETIESSGYQICQSLFAIGTGGWLGMGLTRGLPESIPVADADFIYAAISEEYGALFAILLLIVIIDTMMMMVSISLKLFNPYYKLVSLGISVIYMIQVFLNVGGCVKVVPITGITLPLISAGGSSVIASMMMFGIIEGMNVRHEDEAEKIKREIIEQNSLYSMSLEDEAEKDTRSKIINKHITIISFVMAALLYGCGIYQIYFMAFKASTFINSPYNKRTTLLEKTVKRGNIISSDGVVLAYSEGEKVETDEEFDYKDIESLLGSAYYTVKNGKLTIVDYSDGSSDTLSEGNDVGTTARRAYPYNDMYAHTVGRVSKSMTGIELSQNFTLLTSNINPVEIIMRQLQGKKLPGNDVVVTLDSKLQKAAYEALGDYKGAVVAIEPSTGKILAMVSKPAYNPNTINEEWEKIVGDEKNSKLLNRAAQGTYPPGSTFKILTLLEYIHENPENYEEYEYECTGSGRFEGVTIHCPLGIIHKKENLKESFGNSCNTSFANIGVSLDLDSLHALAESFLFNKKLPTNLTTAVSNFSLTSESEKTTVAQSVIGLSSDTVSPLHEAMIAAAIANQGKLMQPFLVQSVQNANGRVLRNYSSKEYGELCNKEDAAILTEYMTYVVNSGTGSKLKGLGFNVAGKTGTATYNTDKDAHAWFMGFAWNGDTAEYASGKQIAVAVVVESAGAGSKYAVPIAKKVLLEYFK